jgi:hypothetical protein
MLPIKTVSEAMDLMPLAGLKRDDAVRVISKAMLFYYSNDVVEDRKGNTRLIIAEIFKNKETIDAFLKYEGAKDER